MSVYHCSECGRSIGFMGNKFGMPERYVCPHTGRLAKAQAPGRNQTASSKFAAQNEAKLLRQFRIRHDNDSS
jgi:DNA-directed RNA polymerase subunit RPC12/RpoP